MRARAWSASAGIVITGEGENAVGPPMVSRAGNRSVGGRSRVLVLLARRSDVMVIAQHISRSLVAISSRLDTMKAEAGPCLH